MTCPFCKRDPYHYVNNGIGMEPVAVDCCDLGIGLYLGSKRAWRALRDMRNPSPRAKARAMRVLREEGMRPEKKMRIKP